MYEHARLAGINKELITLSLYCRQRKNPQRNPVISHIIVFFLCSFSCMVICENNLRATTYEAHVYLWFVSISERTCVFCVLHLISNPDCLVAPVMDRLFIIITVTASNLTDCFLKKGPLRHRHSRKLNTVVLLRQRHASQRKLTLTLTLTRCVLRACSHKIWKY